MAYFPNGSAGMDYEEQYCSHCVNYRDDKKCGSKGCAIFDLHLLWNYDACNGKDAAKDSAQHAKWLALEHLIPTSNGGIGAEQCTMFVPIEGTEMVLDVSDKLREWEAIYGKRSE